MLYLDYSQSDREHNLSQSYYAETLFISKPNEDSNVILPSERYSNDSEEDMNEKNG